MIIMEKQLSYVSMLSLQEMALRRIAVVLINEPDLLGTIQRVPCDLYRGQWVDTFGFVIRAYISKLQLPESLTKQMEPILKAVGQEILKWRLFHKEILSFDIFDLHAVKKLCWTTAGTIDYKKTAEALVQSKLLLYPRFYITFACLYCLEDYIPMLWEEMPEEYKKICCYINGISEVEIPHIRLFLRDILESYSLPPGHRPRNSFHHSALLGLRTLTEYFFLKLSKEEREASLVETAVDVIKSRNLLEPFSDFKPTQEKLSDVLCYLLSIMTPEEQIRVFKDLPCEVLRCFLDWPWQNLFLDIADVIWTFLPQRKYKDLLSRMESQIKHSKYYSSSVFREFYRRSPRSFKTFFVDEMCSGSEFLFDMFLTANDSKTIELIFRDMDAADRVRVVFSQQVLEIFSRRLCCHDWHIVKVCIQEATLSKEDRWKLSVVFSKCVNTLWRDRSEYHQKFFEILDEMNASPADKRSPEDEILTQVKKSRRG